MNDTARENPEPVTLAKVVVDVLISLMLLLGALAIEWLKNKFGSSGIPLMLLAILNISELTLILSFIAAFIRALRSVYAELGLLFHDIQQSGFWRAIKSIKVGRPTTTGILKALSYGFLSSVVLAVLLLITLWFNNLSTVWLVAGIVLIVVIVLIALIKVTTESGVLGAGASVSSFGISLLALALVPSAALILILRLAGRADLLNQVLDFLLFRR